MQADAERPATRTHTGSAQVFASANDIEAGRYDIRLVSQAGGLVRTSSGVQIATEPLAAVDGLPVHTVILPGGDEGVAMTRARYPDGSTWWAIIFYELRDGLMARNRAFFAPDFDAPDWRAPYRDGDPVPPPEP